MFPTQIQVSKRVGGVLHLRWDGGKNTVDEISELELPEFDLRLEPYDSGALAAT